MISCHDVADYFLALQDPDTDDHLTNLKLQKLVYYAQGFHLAIYDKPLFTEPIEAWQHGPVVSDLYQRFKFHGSSPIPYKDDLDLSKFDVSSKSILDEVYNVFNQFSGWTLRNMTHNEPPWKKHESYAGIIPNEDLKEYFKTRVS